MVTIYIKVLNAFNETKNIEKPEKSFDAWKYELRQHDVTSTVINKLDGIPQYTYWHPEFDVLKHTWLVCRAVMQMDRYDLLEAAFLHDYGKGDKTNIGADKIVLGVPFYGHDFTPPAGSIGYSKIIASKVEYAYRDSLDLMYYDGIPTIVRKTELAKKKLGGIMIWEISLDTLNSDLSLLRALDQTIKAGDCAVKTYYQDADGDGLGNPSHPLQACELPEGYVENRDDAE